MLCRAWGAGLCFPAPPGVSVLAAWVTVPSGGGLLLISVEVQQAVLCVPPLIWVVAFLSSSFT